VIDSTEQFRAAILSTGLAPPREILGDGKLHRFPTNGKSTDDSGWYALHLDDVPYGAFGCWRSGLNKSWCGKAVNDMTKAELESYRARVKFIQTQRLAELEERQRQASAAAALIWSAAVPAADHEYLNKKGVEAHGIKCDGHHLLVPMRDSEGKLQSLQTIAPNGSKRFQPGGRVKGCYHSIGKPGEMVVVCEGYATGASIYEATGLAVAVAFNAGNLSPVAKALRAKYPQMKLVVAADDDQGTPGNPGLASAIEAARAADCYLAKPYVIGDRPPGATDFNDLYQAAGAHAVRTCFEPAALTHRMPMLASRPEMAETPPWPDPIPLPDALPAVKEFDAELLPEALRGWVDDTAHRMQCPPDFPAVGALVAISSLIGARAVVAPKSRDDWRVVPNLWGLVVGRPGVKKSPALGEALKPLFRLEEAEREEWQEAREAWELDCKVAELAAKQNEKQAAAQAARDPAKARALLEPMDIPLEPKARRYVVNDATVEKLGELLVANPWGLLVYRDELHGLLCSMDRQGQEGARGFYLTGYDGNQGYAVDRIGRGESYIPRVCLAMLGGIQPGKLQSYVREAVAGGAGDDGLLQRFGVAVWPDVRREFEYVDKLPDRTARQQAWAVFDRLALLLPASDTEAQEWRFSPDAQAAFQEWLVPFETEIRGDERKRTVIPPLRAAA
jgi:putative DNA primase/helicase